MKKKFFFSYYNIENIRNRPDCWYGRKCRTQTNKQDHARNYNHICEQTHF